MRKKLAIVVVFMLLSLTACSQNTLENADKLYQKGNFDESIQMYEEIIEKSEDQEAEVRLKSIESEIKAVKQMEKIKLFISDLARNKIREGVEVTNTDMAYYVKDIEEEFKKLDDIKVDSSTEIGKYIASVKDSVEYTMVEIIELDVEDARVSDILEEVDYYFVELNSITKNFYKDKIREFDVYLENKPIPVFYEKLLSE